MASFADDNPNMKLVPVPNQSTAVDAVFDDEGQGHVFAEEGLPLDYKDEAYSKAQTALEKATLRAEGAKTEKQRAASIYKTQERTLHYSQVVAQIEDARVASIKEPGKVFVAVDQLDELFSTRGRTIPDIPLEEATFHCAFLNGEKISVSDAYDMDLVDECMEEVS